MTFVLPEGSTAEAGRGGQSGPPFAAYGLHAMDAVHLATALNAGATRFLTNNAADFPKSIGEIDVTYPADLPGE